MRSSAGTKLGLDAVVVSCTNARSAFFASPSFHAESGSCANAAALKPRNNTSVAIVSRHLFTPRDMVVLLRSNIRQAADANCAACCNARFSARRTYGKLAAMVLQD